MASRRERDIEWLRESFKNHKGGWLTEEAVKKYQELAKKISGPDKVMAGERRNLCLQLIKEYGVTELEAINIINGYCVGDYIAKYERIKTQTPLIIENDKLSSKKGDGENHKDE